MRVERCSLLFAVLANEKLGDDLKMPLENLLFLSELLLQLLDATLGVDARLPERSLSEQGEVIGSIWFGFVLDLGGHCGVEMLVLSLALARDDRVRHFLRERVGVNHRIGGILMALREISVFDDDGAAATVFGISPFALSRGILLLG